MAEEPVSSMEDQLIEEREILRRQVDQLQVEKRNAVDRIRSEFEKQVQEANAAVRELRRQLENEQHSSQKLNQQQQEQMQQNIQLKDALAAKERQISQVTMEKHKLVSLLETSQTEIATIRGKSSQQTQDIQDLNSEIGMLKMQVLDAKLDIDLAKVGERNYRAECEQHRLTVEKLHSDLLAKDREINRARTEANQQVKEQLQKVSALEESVWTEKQKHNRYEETIRSLKQSLEEQKSKMEEIKRAQAKREEDFEASDASYRMSVTKLKDQMEVYNRRIELLESETKINEKTIEDIQSASETGLRKAQEEITRLTNELEQQKQSILDSEGELESARELTAYLKHDRSRIYSPELMELVRSEGFSVVRLYYEYQRTVNKLTEVSADQERMQQDLEINQQTYQMASEIQERYQEEKAALDSAMEDLRSNLSRAEGETRQLAATNRTLNQQLYKLERVNRTFEGRIQMLEKYLESPGFSDFDNSFSISGRNPAKLIEVNTSLMDINADLNEEVQNLKDEREQWMRQRGQFVEDKEKIDIMLNAKEEIDSRIRQLAEEVSQYRKANENPLYKDFLRSLSENEELQKAVIGMSGDERIQYAFIRANGGGEALDRISRLENDLNATKQQFANVKNENGELKRDMETRKAKYDRELLEIKGERDRALSEVEAVKNGMELVKQEIIAKNAELSRQMAKVTELFEKLCERERDMTILQNTLEQEREKIGRISAELNVANTELSSRKNVISVLEQQQIILQRSIDEKSLALQSSQQKSAELSQELRQLRAEFPTQQASSVTREELNAEKQRHEATIRHLEEIKKRLDDVTRAPRSDVPDHVPSTSSLSRPSSGAGSADFAMNIIRQSSQQQEQLQQQIRDLQTQLAKTKDEVSVKTAELDKIQQEAAKKAQESSGASNSMLSSIGRITEDRDVLRKQVDDLRAQNAKLVSESHRLEEMEKRLRQEVQELNIKCANELKAHQNSQAATADLRKEIDQLKQTLALSKRREHELTKSIDDLTKNLAAQETTFKESVRLLEEERENAVNWKRALYDQIQSSTSSRISDDALDLTILVDYQKKENDNLTKQLQMAKEQFFSTAAQLRIAQSKVAHLQEDLNASLQGRESSGDSSNWRSNYVEQHGILASTMELNGKLRHDLAFAQNEISALKTSLEKAEQKLEPVIQRVQELEQENLHLQQESRLLKEQLEKWSFTQQKTEMDTLKRKVADADTHLNAEIKRLKELYLKQMSTKINEVKKELSAKTTEVTNLQTALDGKEAEIADISAQNGNALRDLENAQRGAADKATEVTKLREELARQQEQLAQKSEQILRLQAMLQQRSEAEELNVEPLPPTAPETTRPSSAAGVPSLLPRPVQQASPTHISKSTAVVTPQAHGPPPVSQTQQRSRDALPRGSNPPVVAVAPQAQEQGNTTTQTATVAPHIMVQQPTVGLALHDHQSSDPEASSSGVVPSTSHATAPFSTMGTVQGMTTRRRLPADDDSSSDTGSPERKRLRPIPGKQLQIQLRPPSPTSSDVTSSTAPGTQSAVALPTSGTGETVPHRPRSRSSAGVQAPVELNAGASSSQTVQEEAGFGDDGTGSGEERAVDSSENVAVGQGAETMSGGDNVADMEGDVMSSEEQDDDQMDADESGQVMAMEPVFANTAEWPGTAVTASDEAAQPSPQPMISSEADYNEEQRQDDNLGDTGGESVSDITSSEMRPFGDETSTSVPAPETTQQALEQDLPIALESDNRMQIPDFDISAGDIQDDTGKEGNVMDLMSGQDDLSEGLFEELLAQNPSAGTTGHGAAVSGPGQTVMDIPEQTTENMSAGTSQSSGPQPTRLLNVRMRPPLTDAGSTRPTLRNPTQSLSPRPRQARRPISPPTPTGDEPTANQRLGARFQPGIIQHLGVRGEGLGGRGEGPRGAGRGAARGPGNITRRGRRPGGPPFQ